MGKPILPRFLPLLPFPPILPFVASKIREASMSRAVFCLVAAGLSIASAVRAAAQGPSRDRTPDPVGTAVIRGRVVDAATGDPVRKVRVRTMGGGLRDGRTGTTDAEGRYEIKTLPAGKYFVRAQKPAYVATSFGQLKPGEVGTQIDLAAGQTIDRVDIKIWRGGVVAGRVTDEAGEPVADVQVGLSRFQFINGERRSMTTMTRITNDAGEFRLFGVEPGQYYLGAVYRPVGVDVPLNQTDYAPTYFPGTPNVADAQRLTIEAGAVLTGMNLTLEPVRAVRVSGVVIAASGEPLTSGSVVFTQPAVPGGNKSAMIKPDGTFSISNVTPGEYILRASTPQTQTGPAELAQLTMTVGAMNVDDVRLTAVKPTVIKGRLVTDAGATARPVLSSAQVINVPTDSFSIMSRLGMPVTSTVKDDFTFELKAFPGRILLNAAPLPAGWAQNAIRVNGVDVTNTGIDVAGEALTGVEIVITNIVGELSGQVLDASGQPTRSAWVILFTQDRYRWRPPARFSQATRPGPDNRYKLTIVQPDKFYVAAVDNVEPGEWTDPEFLDRIRSRALMIDVGEAEHKTLNLTLAPSSR
jgi:Carboxypeptidase regulatory-like domain